MTKKDKLIDKIRNNPTNIRFETIQTILLDHYILTVPKQKPVSVVYVKLVVSVIDELTTR